MRKAPRKYRTETTHIVFVPFISLLTKKQWMKILLAFVLLTIGLATVSGGSIEIDLGPVLLVAIVAIIALKWRPILTFVRKCHSSPPAKRRR